MFDAEVGGGQHRGVANVTRARADDLIRVATAMHANVGAGRKPAEREAMAKWVAEAKELAPSTLANDRRDLLEGTQPFERLLAGHANVTPDDLTAGLGRVSVALMTLWKREDLASTPVDDEHYVRFLRAAVYEDGQLGMGEPLNLPRVSKTARLTGEEGRLCLLRGIEDEVVQQHQPGDDFLIDQERAAFTIDEVPRRRPATSSPTGAVTAVRTDPRTALITEWKAMLQGFEGALTLSFNASTPVGGGPREPRPTRSPGA